MAGISEVLVGKAVAAGKSALWGRLKQLLNADRDRLNALYRELMDEIEVEAAIALDRLEASQSATSAAFEHQLDQLREQQKALRAYLAYVEEARRSRDKRRIRMLAGALAGTFRPDVNEDIKSRAFRVALQLEPSDVIVLRQFGVGHPPPSGHHDEEQRRRSLSSGSPESYIALLSNGCLTREDFEDPERRDLRADTFRSSGFPHRTTLGMAVLDLLEGWVDEGAG